MEPRDDMASDLEELQGSTGRADMHTEDSYEVDFDDATDEEDEDEDEEAEEDEDLEDGDLDDDYDEILFSDEDDDE